MSHTYVFQWFQYADMMFVYEFCDENINAARREYAAQFPNKKLLNKYFLQFSTIERNWCNACLCTRGHHFKQNI